jgi:hypothetical protein
LPPPPQEFAPDTEYPPPLQESLPPPQHVPSGMEYPALPAGGQPQRSRTPLLIAVSVAVPVLLVAGLLIYKFVLKNPSSSSTTSSGASSGATFTAPGSPTNSAPGGSTHSTPGGPTHSTPGAPPNGGTGEKQYLSDLSSVGITSSTATPAALLNWGHIACSDLAAGKSQAQAAADIVKRSNSFFNQRDAQNIVRFAVKDICPQQG